MKDDDFLEWVNHHLHLGINHIYVYDNGCFCNIEQLCKSFNNITYEKVEGHPCQYDVYNDVIHNKSKATYIMPVDDDEYLSIDTEFSSIQDALEYYEKQLGTIDCLGIHYKYMFPKSFNSERIGSILEYCNLQDDYTASRFSAFGNNVIKCLVRREVFDTYVSADVSIEANHIPKTITLKHKALLCNGQLTLSQYASCFENDKIRLIHCPFTGLTNYMRKRQDRYTVSHTNNTKRYSHFDYIVDNNLLHKLMKKPYKD